MPTAGRGLLPTLVGATLCVSLVATLGTPLIPTIALEHDVSLDAAQWVLTVTLLVGAVATPIIGRLGDGSRRRDVLTGTVLAVLLGCIVAATASSLGQLLLGRALMGVGWGAAPVAIAIACENFDGAHRHGVVATLSVAVAVGTGLGFPLTSMIAHTFDIGVAFWVGAAASAVVLASIRLHVPPSPVSTGRPPIDVIGALLLGSGLGALLLAVSRGHYWGWGSALTLGLAGGALALLLIWILFELRVADPLVDVRALSQRALVGVNVMTLLLGASVYMSLSLVNWLAQSPGGTGGSIVIAGLLLMPISFGSLLAQPLARVGLQNHGFRAVLFWGALFVAGASFGLSLFHGDVIPIAIGTMLLGVGIGSTFAAAPVLITASVSSLRAGSATSVNQVLRNVGGASGSVLGATVLAAATPVGATYPMATGYPVAFAIAGAIAIAGAAAAFWLVPRSRRSDLRVGENEAAPLG